MKKPPVWALALILPLSGISVVGLLCLTAIHFQEGNLQLRFEAPGGLRIDAGVDKRRGNEVERLLLPEDDKAQTR